MAITARQIWAKTSFFQVDFEEDQQTNPGRFGRAFAYWLAEQFQARGETVQEVLPEDWGWCVMLTRKPYMLWVGCANRSGSIDEWGAFVAAEPGFLQRLFSWHDTRLTVDRIDQILHEIMQQIPGAGKIWIE
ncbi:hypothetical protein FHW12_004254 [Dokdonella fugitiva]|uniref:Uncharacterized protein n=1 Tax=Dokdonella fugitiva TaxID=328517 RepID=A0A839EZ59_9GAMM|nr:hypothetical protein [Dokdonella fugitiva]MBA8890007.1 hypothetical protein [Dokdonella fugitiva]